jgi:hypothetical protein
MIYPRIEWSTGAKWFWIALTAVVVALWGAGWYVRLTQQRGKLHDFVQEWTSARNHFRGEPIYQSLAVSVSREFGPEYVRLLPIQVNAHPPASVLLFLPLAAFDYLTAYRIWIGALAICLATSICLIIRPAALNYSWWTLLPITCTVLTCDPVALDILYGQFNSFLLLLITGSWAAYRSHHGYVAGVLLGVAAAIKVFPAFLCLYFVVKRQWMHLFAAAAAAVLCNGVAGLVLGWDCFGAYVSEVLPQVDTFRDWWGNISLAGFWSRLLHAPSRHVEPLLDHPALAQLMYFGSALIVTAVAAWKAHRAQSTADEDLAFSTLVVTMLLVSPIAWSHYAVMLALPIAVAWKHFSITQPRQRWIPLLIIVLLGLSLMWLWDSLIPGSGEIGLRGQSRPGTIYVVTLLAYPCYVILGLWVVLVVARGKDRPAVGNLVMSPLTNDRTHV